MNAPPRLNMLFWYNTYSSEESTSGLIRVVPPLNVPEESTSTVGRKKNSSLWSAVSNHSSFQGGLGFGGSC